MAEGYPNIADHGLIGDLQTAALIDTDGTLDWFCAPRFDSPSVFASLLDAEHGGYCRVRPATDDYVSRQLYLPDTAILITRFMTEEGVGELVDFMPVEPGEATDRHRIVRMLRVVRGTMSFIAEVKPRFDYGRASHRIVPSDGAGAKVVSDTLSLTLHRVGDPVLHGAERAGQVELDGDGIRITGSLHAGEMAGVMLETGDAEPRRIPLAEMDELQLETTRFWRDWNGRSTYRGRWREMVGRSAMTLKLMTYAPTGALVAAPTAGLPEQVGGERNWDYRYTWIRDASFSVYALLGLGYTDEAEAFVTWLMERIHESVGEGSGPLKIMYRVDGSSDLVEDSLEDFEGYRGSKPVRIGNGAADQLQLDIYGEAMDSIYLADTHGLQLPHAGWTQISEMLDWVCDNWDQPDEGIWETRGGRQNFTYGRFMCWVALDRGIRLAQSRGRPAPIPRWREQRDAIYAEIMKDGWSAERGAFVQYQGTDVLDASLLVMPLMGFIAPRDPMWLSTLAAMDTELVSDSLVYRYNPSASPDGLRGHEGTFTLCSFWYVDALARSGRLEEAQLTFEKMLTYANHLGLYAEEIGLTGEQLGNFPQAFSHLSLINAAVNLDYQLDHGSGVVDPVLTKGRRQT
ncbi:Glucoamylase (glucan-1,4-alpha-glucosidase), GH15 family [Microbacterium sp. cf046]|uniref:glycoside hydrolase family 15 protein n=1 Tax=Microbacterium sp. cf046 TaxID=1761803 RepID=UPI0008E53C44|nr:glycoside hydrolase family 15 protein [Microbacterium sp. cf046]SFS07595.1 Glucoamylase (glucan-1,4-alpha-glucosidase), GH15 family [Microbacterium sp. cf046]